jgi:cyclophilin family peptidyl-prolyl cis-trans isomerase
MKTFLKGVFVCFLAAAFNAVAAPPIITSQPQSVTVNTASTATFSVTATNAATYQWVFAGGLVRGETNATYVLDDVATNQEGLYSVIVTSSTGESSNSQPAQLTIIPGTIVQWTLSNYADGSSSNFLVQLFDHDKPATVENFIHYITSGAFSNTFIDRDVTNFVIQGGDYVTYDRSTNALNGGPVSAGTNIFPSQLENEYGVGPLIPNHFGTLAMGLKQGETNSASGAFFFNTADNSASLDGQDFVVFGRILTGSNVLQWFNTLNTPSNGIFQLQLSIPTLPVDYFGTNQPTDASLFYCDFAFVTADGLPALPPVDSTPPTVSITFPTPAEATIASGGTLTLTGTASDNVGLAEVFCVLTPLTGLYANQSYTNTAIGVTDWSLGIGTLAPGTYQLTAYSQDGAGNISAPATVYVSNMVQLTIITNVGGQRTTNTQLYTEGGQYSVTAAPGPGELFEYWENRGVTSIDPVQTFTAETNFTMTVTLVATNLPGGLAVTSPSEGATVQTTNAGNMTISGTFPTSITLSQITCQLFSQSNAVSAPLVATPGLAGTGTWSLDLSDLVSGPYTVVVIAVDSLGREDLVRRDFTAVVTAPTISSQPASLIVNAGSSATFSVEAANAVTYQWMVGGNAIPGATTATLNFEDVATNHAGVYTVLLTSSTGNYRVSQPAQLTVLQGTIVQLAFSGYAAGGTSNVTVELFDHDKPATVQNFLHYIVSGAYSNLFWSRCVPGFVLQGGDYSTMDRTSGSPPRLISINSTFTDNLGYAPPFPFRIDNEFGVGPLIHNTFGTVAMAKTPGDPDSALSTFFFNLTDNTTNLDVQNGGFTVFGRILSGSNVLDYFNTLSAPTIYTRINPASPPTNGLYESGGSSFSSLPVNFFRVTTPGDSNLIYVDFSFPVTPIPDTNSPTVALTYPLPGATITNRDVIVSGTASDDIGLARVVPSVTSPLDKTGEATGTTNWSFDFGNLPPGSITLYITAQDGAGNLSSPLQTSFIMPQYPFSVSTNGPGILSTNLNSVTTSYGTTYSVKAVPNRGALFVNWSSGSTVSINPISTFAMPNGLQMTAMFVSNTLPNGISFTYPTANATVKTNSFALTGKVAKASGMTTITAQVFSKTSGESVTGPMVASGNATWSIPNVQLAPGVYIVQALASNTLGKTTVITENFTVLAQVTVNIIGPGATSIANGAYLESGKTYAIRATPKAGGLFYGWTGSSGLIINPTISFSMTNGLAVTATFVSNTLANKLSFTYPKANSQLLTNGFIMTGNVSASVGNPQIIVQLFSGSLPATGLLYATANGASWSLPFSSLPQGSYTAVALASDSGGKQTMASESFKVNLFPNIAGTYYGVFLPTNITAETAGFFKLTVSATGAMTGKLEFPAGTFVITYPLSAVGGVQLSGNGFGGTVYFNVSFDLTNGTDTVTGYIDSLNSYAPFTGYRAVTQLPANTVAGKYLLDFETVTNDAGSGPTNDGFASLSIAKTGALTLSGTLADNTTFSEGVGISKTGVWPVYVPLYKGLGMLIGSETNVAGPNGSSGSQGTVYWVKAPTKDTYFTNGFSLEASANGTNYVAPLPGSHYQVVFSGGTINTPLINTLTVSAARQFVPAPGALDKLTISLSTAGVITGKFLNPADNQTLQIHGAFSNPTIGGLGFVLDSNGQSEPFQIAPIP